jgi:hypothetical protein
VKDWRPIRTEMTRNGIGEQRIDDDVGTGLGSYFSDKVCLHRLRMW